MSVFQKLQEWAPSCLFREFEPYPQHHVAHIFNKPDKDGDGQLDAMGNACSRRSSSSTVINETLVHEAPCSSEEDVLGTQSKHSLEDMLKAPYPHHHADDIFKKLDKDGNGQLDAKEFGAFAKIVFPELARKPELMQRFDVRAVMAHVDSDRNGTIGVNELRAFLRCYNPATQSMTSMSALVFTDVDDDSIMRVLRDDPSKTHGMCNKFDLVVGVVENAGKVHIKERKEFEPFTAQGSEGHPNLVYPLTELTAFLESRGVTDIYCCCPGLVCENCVKSSALHCANEGFKTSVIEDGCWKPFDADEVWKTKVELKEGGVSVLKREKAEEEVNVLKFRTAKDYLQFIKV